MSDNEEYKGRPNRNQEILIFLATKLEEIMKCEKIDSFSCTPEWGCRVEIKVHRLLSGTRSST